MHFFLQGKWARLFLRKYEFKIGWNWCKLGKIGVNWRKLKLPIFAICINFRQFLQFASIFANFFRGLIGHYLFNRNFTKFYTILQTWISLVISIIMSILIGTVQHRFSCFHCSVRFARLLQCRKSCVRITTTNVTVISVISRTTPIFQNDTTFRNVWDVDNFSWTNALNLRANWPAECILSRYDILIIVAQSDTSMRNIVFSCGDAR